MEIGVRVESERWNEARGEPVHVASAYLVFVAIDAEGHPREIPALVTETPDAAMNTCSSPSSGRSSMSSPLNETFRRSLVLPRYAPFSATHEFNFDAFIDQGRLYDELTPSGMAGMYKRVASFLNQDLSNETGISKTATDLRDQGRLGIKSGGGFFDYTPERVQQLTAQRAAKLVGVRKVLES